MPPRERTRLGNQTRFADARVARDQRDRAAARTGLLDQLQQDP